MQLVQRPSVDNHTRKLDTLQHRPSHIFFPTSSRNRGSLSQTTTAWAGVLCERGVGTRREPAGTLTGRVGPSLMNPAAVGFTEVSSAETIAWATALADDSSGGS